TISLVNTIVYANGTNGIVGFTMDHSGYPASYPFQTAVGGSHYLNDDCGCRNVGTISIDLNLLTELQTKTTYQPLAITNTPISGGSITLSPRVQRDTDEVDLGYHYDPLDCVYVASQTTNAATVTIEPGTAIAMCGSGGYKQGLWLSGTNSHWYAQGTA